MPDAPDMVAFFYEPMMLAFESDKEIQLRSSTDEVITPIVCSESISSLSN